MGSLREIPYFVVRVVELEASVTLPDIAFPSVPVLFPLPIERSATVTPLTLLDLPSGNVVPVEWEPLWFAFVYDPPGVDTPRDSVSCRVIEFSSEVPVASVPVADKGTEATSIFTDQAAS